MSAMFDDARPMLLCLNLRRDHISAGTQENVAALARAAALLRRARQEGWRVLHVYTRGDAASGARAFGGVEPLVHEPVFDIDTVSAFDEPQILEAARLNGRRPIVLAGGLFSRAGLALALAAQNLGLHVQLADAACVETHFEPVEPDRVRALARPYGEAADEKFGVGKGEVICLNEWRK